MEHSPPGWCHQMIDGLIPDVVVTLDVDLVEDPLRWLQEVLLHLHGNVPGQKTHQQAFLRRWALEQSRGEERGGDEHMLTAAARGREDSELLNPATPAIAGGRTE